MSFWTTEQPAVCSEAPGSVKSQGPNPFVDVLVPVALQSDMVLQALLTLSGVHLLQKGSHCYDLTIWEHQAQALRSLKYGVTKFVMSEDDLAYSLSICTLIFCFIEEQVVNGCISCATSLERDILLDSVRKWEPTSSSDSDCAIAGKIYQLALTALLQIDADKASLQCHVASVSTLLQALPFSSSVTTTLCWPITMLGSLTRLYSCKSTIRFYMELLAAQYKFEIFRQSLHLLDTLWEAEEAPVESILSIQSAMKRNGYFFTFA
ncbi:C6 zinc finger domain protein [Penicillium brevicompactum]|uniref:C6 zinc finger domain protein n=1 Tax=Penicillium brevicompactum TaxID=5074 RepID=UPI002540E8A4|nr:C6 zinc finger domain protein [Penicillium brevicompactum]KAJ5343219.1 C6 zinc finger domain protein [Penicillium brevicompactum]